MSVLALILQGVAALAGAVVLRLGVDEIVGRWQQHIEAEVEAVLASLSDGVRAERADDWRSARYALARRPISMALWTRRFRRTVSERPADLSLLRTLDAKIGASGMLFVITVIVMFVVAVLVPTGAIIAMVVNAAGVDDVVSIGDALSNAVSGAVSSIVGNGVDNAVNSAVGISLSGIAGGAAFVYAVVCVFLAVQFLVVSVEQFLGLIAVYATRSFAARRGKGKRTG
ncbi:MAG TPA: hypothetical protein VLJ42_04510 [Solirubrobacteraceae bacterium]|nr:hypothetical protein [Solirubrobacteraceae bacterium]